MTRRLPLLAIAAIAGCTMPTPPRSAPTAAEFAVLLSRAHLAAVIARLPRWRLASDSGEILWATRTTRLFRFVDDVFIAVESSDAGSIVRVRSASRVGRDDLGQNRRNISELWAALGPAP